MKAVVFAYHDMGCTGTLALLEAGYDIGQSLPIRTRLEKTTFSAQWRVSPPSAGSRFMHRTM